MAAVEETAWTTSQTNNRRSNSGNTDDPGHRREDGQASKAPSRIIMALIVFLRPDVLLVLKLFGVF